MHRHVSIETPKDVLALGKQLNYDFTGVQPGVKKMLIILSIVQFVNFENIYITIHEM